MKPPSVLHYFRCRVCASILIIGIKTRQYEPCNGCRSYMKFVFEQAVETPEQQDCALEVAKLGRVFRWSPSADPFAYTPARFPMEHITKAELAQTARDDDERMEAAYRAADEGNR